MNVKHVTSIAISSLLTLGLVTGCGGGGTETKPDETSPTPAETTTPTPAETTTPTPESSGGGEKDHKKMDDKKTDGKDGGKTPAAGDKTPAAGDKTPAADDKTPGAKASP